MRIGIAPGQPTRLVDDQQQPIDESFESDCLPGIFGSYDSTRPTTGGARTTLLGIVLTAATSKKKAQG